MRENDGRKLDHRALETLRVRAVEQVNSGARPDDVAAALGLNRSTVYGWLAKYKEGGWGALAARPVPGRPPRLSALQVRRLWILIVGSDPRQLQFDFALWTREMVRELIRRELGVGLSVVSVGRLLAKMGLSPQRLLYRAYQQDPQKVQRWKENEYPQIAAQAAAAGATIWCADEARIRSDERADTAQAPGRPDPGGHGHRCSARREHGLRGHLQGALRFAVFEDTSAGTFTAFCKRLLHDAPGPVYLIVDDRPSHRANSVTQFVASTEGRLTLFHLPGYSPELNSDEWV